MPAGTIIADKIQNTSGGSINNTNGLITFVNNNNEAIRIDTSGSVGIGSATSPQMQLTVGGSLSATGFLYGDATYLQNTYKRAVVNGSVRAIFIGSGGSGYSSPPTVVIEPPTDTIGNNIQATATCTISNGVVNSITITNAGRGYLRHPNISFVGGGSPSNVATAWALADVRAHANPKGSNSLQSQAFLTQTGELYGAGRAYYGSLPIGYYGDIWINAPAPLIASDGSLGGFNNHRIVEFWHPGETIYALDNEGCLWSAGIGNYGQNGNARSDHLPAFGKINQSYFGNSPIVRFAVGRDTQSDNNITCLALAANGNLYGWGYNGWGQLGVGDQTVRYSPVQITGAGTGIKDIYVNNNSNTISCFVLKNDGTVYSAGWSNYGELGRGIVTSTVNTFGLVLTSPGVPLTNVKEIHGCNGGVSGTGSTFFLCNDGTLWATGYNGVGQLGLGDYSNRSYATYVSQLGASVKIFRTFDPSGDHASCYAYDTAGRLWSWGRNYYGQLGLGWGNSTDRVLPTQVPAPAYKINIRGNAGGSYVGVPNWSWTPDLIKDIAVGWHFAAFVTNDGRVFVSGYNGYYQLGQGDTDLGWIGVFSYVRLPFNNAVAVNIHQYYNQSILQIITSEGRVYTIGSNNYGSLGVGSSNSTWYTTPLEFKMY